MAEESLTFRIKAIDEGSAPIGRFAANARHAAHQVESGGIEGAKEAFGRTSKFTEAFHVLGGAGPIIGLGIASRELGEMAEKMGRVKEDLRDVNKNAADVSLDFLKIIPVVGDFASAGEAINELLTDQQHKVDLITESIRLQDEYTKAHVADVLNLRNAYAEVAQAVAKMNAETRNIGLRGQAGSYAGISTGLQEHLQNLQAIQAGGGPPGMIREIQGLSTNDTAKKIDDLRKGKAKQDEELYAAKSRYESEKAGSFGSFEQHRGAEDRAEIAEAAMRVQQTDAQIKSLQKDQHNAEVQIRSKYSAENSAEVQKGNAELLNVQREYAQQRIDQTAQSEKIIRDTQADAQASALRNSGQNLAAELLSIQHGLAEQNLAVDVAMRNRQKEIEQAQKSQLLTPLQAKEESDFAQGEANRQKQSNADKARGDSDAARKNDAIAQEQIEQRIAGIRNSALSAALQMGGKSMEFERENLRITEEYAAKKLEITELMKTANHAQKEALGLTLQMLQAEEKIAHQAESAKVLQEAVNAPMQQAAAAGNRVAALMLKQQEIQKEFADRGRALDKIIGDKDSSAREKALAKSVKSNLPDEEKRAMMRAAAASMPFINPNAPTEMFQTIGGIGMRGGAEMASEKSYLAYKQPLGLTGAEAANFHSGDDLQRDIVHQLDDLNKKMQTLVDHTTNPASKGTSNASGIFN